MTDLKIVSGAKGDNPGHGYGRENLKAQSMRLQCALDSKTRRCADLKDTFLQTIPGLKFIGVSNITLPTTLKCISCFKPSTL